MWDMGGYGIYIWPAYVGVLVGLAGLMVRSLHQAKRQKMQLQQKFHSAKK